ncbi:GMP synthase (glutamine-hydrolysing) [Andreprevotia lacus DSM 23236]|jgi:GMP synthase (glutamine-hydrolysing)|uniref:GMP synthase (Glutamine-hydrolysing) n=1 Tax=Andreprevotia lacus DSM 23236 TaxID=1121001 RepID=A0A1W1XN96_9NEIS|nr:glutamine amidotransferase [Andreprevotia lacus]SMC25344.1 GMP synthase (glutamine-hydrolysing) [Andreprevotia lacus DSM 23236]
MSKTAHIIRHLAFEGPGLLAELLPAHGYRLQQYDAGITPLPEALPNPDDLLLVLGGPLGANDTADYPWLAQEIALIRKQLHRRAPVLGICLGAQLMARALGAPVMAMPQREIGYAPLKLNHAGSASPLAPLQGEAVLHWHGDQFALPHGATLLAASAGCPHQAFAIDNHALALQFHLETDWQDIERWLIGHTGELRASGIAPASLRQAAAQAGPRLRTLAQQVLSNWLAALPGNQAPNPDW